VCAPTERQIYFPSTVWYDLKGPILNNAGVGSKHGPSCQDLSHELTSFAWALFVEVAGDSTSAAGAQPTVEDLSSHIEHGESQRIPICGCPGDDIGMSEL
jgi:hypothetical protein